MMFQEYIGRTVRDGQTFAENKAPPINKLSSAYNE